MMRAFGAVWCDFQFHHCNREVALYLHHRTLKKARVGSRFPKFHIDLSVNADLIPEAGADSEEEGALNVGESVFVLSAQGSVDL